MEIALPRVRDLVVGALVLTASGVSAASAAGLMVGAAVRDITPGKEMLPLNRAPAETMTAVLDPIRVRVIALSSGGPTALGEHLHSIDPQ